MPCYLDTSEEPSIFMRLWTPSVFNIPIPCPRSLCDEIVAIWKWDKQKHYKYIYKSRNSILSALPMSVPPKKWKEGDGNSRGCFGFERSCPEDPALIKASLRVGMRRMGKMNAAREKPIDTWRGWPSRLKMRALETTRPGSVRPETRIEFEGHFLEGSGKCSAAIWSHPLEDGQRR
jgi:hypothetical protein